jgi:sporulation protein YlmC with PRC-barrel domain
MKCFAAAALALLVAMPAMAGPGTDSTAPAAKTEATMNNPAPSGSDRFMTNQAPNQWLVGNLWNRNVYNAAGQSIGDLKDVLIGPDGKVQALIVGVGGFLGLGEKNVAVDYGYLEGNGGITPNRITLNMSEQDLRNAPSFVRTSSSK